MTARAKAACSAVRLTCCAIAVSAARNIVRKARINLTASILSLLSLAGFSVIRITLRMCLLLHRRPLQVAAGDFLGGCGRERHLVRRHHPACGAVESSRASPITAAVGCMPMMGSHLSSVRLWTHSRAPETVVAWCFVFLWLMCGACGLAGHPRGVLCLSGVGLACCARCRGNSPIRSDFATMSVRESMSAQHSKSLQWDSGGRFTARAAADNDPPIVTFEEVVSDKERRPPWPSWSSVLIRPGHDAWAPLLIALFVITFAQIAFRLSLFGLHAFKCESKGLCAIFGPLDGEAITFHVLAVVWLTLGLWACIASRLTQRARRRPESLNPSPAFSSELRTGF